MIFSHAMFFNGSLCLFWWRAVCGSVCATVLPQKNKIQRVKLSCERKTAHTATALVCMQSSYGSTIVCTYSLGPAEGCEKCINFFSRFAQWVGNWGSWLLFQLSYEWLPMPMWLCLLIGWMKLNGVLGDEHEWVRESARKRSGIKCLVKREK